MAHQPGTSTIVATAARRAVSAPAVARGATCRCGRAMGPVPGCGTALRIPQYRLHRTKGLAYTRAGGRMRYLGPWGSPESQHRYHQLVAEWLVVGRDLTAPRRELSVEQLIAAYRASLCRERQGVDGPAVSPAAEAAFRPLLALYGPTPARAFGPVALKAVRHELVGSGISRVVVNQRITAIRRVFRFGVADQLLPADVSHALAAVEPLRPGQSVAAEPRDIGPVAAEHVIPVVQMLPATLATMVALQWLTGMRSGEVCQIRAVDLDTSRPNVWCYCPQTHKTAHRGYRREILLGPIAQAILRPYLVVSNRDGFLFAPARAMVERKQQAQCPDAEPAYAGLRPRFDSYSYRRAIRYGIARAHGAGTLPSDVRWHPHQLRHAAATRLAAAHGVEVARILLGHQSVVQTEHYVEPQLAPAIAATVHHG